ncbi:hypothetical protein Dimus_031299 [Dionaea muscipula]
MLGFTASARPALRIPDPPIPRITASFSHQSRRYTRPINVQFRALKRIRRQYVVVRAAENGDGKGKEGQNQENDNEGVVGGGEDMKRGNNQQPTLNLRWAELLLDPDPDNVLAVGLTGLLTWASVQVLWQLLIVSLAILVAALKYSLIAALLLFILVTLL